MWPRVAFALHNLVGSGLDTHGLYILTLSSSVRIDYTYLVSSIHIILICAYTGEARNCKDLQFIPPVGKYIKNYNNSAQSV
jgi:hypothetical protein